MKSISVLLCFCLIWIPFNANLTSATSDSAVTMPMKYEGGSLPLQQHDGVKVTMDSSYVTIKQGKQSHQVMVKSITEVSYGADVHRRVGAAIGVGVFTLGIGALMALVKTKKHFVGMTWDEKSVEGTSVKKGGVVFKVGKGEYRGYITALEGLTGLKAVNADSVGAGGTSKP